jgi:bifunctional DNA-binding transcriptional regulator/antitoxin component of YhaV-PrlF toxin-antitoxin module
MAKSTPPTNPSSETQGFSEGQAKYQASPELPQRWVLKVAPDGRFVIPAAARAAMDIAEDGAVTAYLHEGELRLISRRTAIRQVQAFVKLHRKSEGSVVDELIAERRAAAERGD